MLNPECNFDYDDIDFSMLFHSIIGMSVVIEMNFEDPITKQDKPIFTDQDGSKTMFRVVVKSNINSVMVDNLIRFFWKT